MASSTRASAAQHTVAVAQVHSLLLGLRHQGRDVAPLLQRVGIAPALLGQPAARVPHPQVAALIRALRRAMRDELWGLTSRPLPVGSFGRCLRAMLGCATLGEALHEGLAQLRLGVPDFAGRLRVQGGQAQLWLQSRLPANPRLDHAQKTCLLFAYGVACWLVARPVPLLRVDYPGEPPRGSDTARIYRAPLRTGQARLALVLDAQWLGLPVVQGADQLRGFLAEAPANLLLRYRDTGGLGERICRLLRPRLAEPLPALEALAPALGLAPATLRRRLRDEGRGYQQLKDSLRQEQALLLLARPELPLAEVGRRLGFADASAFHRAFRKWTGLAPGEHRQRLDLPCTAPRQRSVRPR